MTYQRLSYCSENESYKLQVVYVGSFDQWYGTTAWCIDGDGSIIMGVNVVPIGSDILDTTKCKLAGIFAILRIPECMVQYFNLNEASIEVGFECKSGFNRTLLSIDKTPLYYTTGLYLNLINTIQFEGRVSSRLRQSIFLHIKMTIIYMRILY